MKTDCYPSKGTIIEKLAWYERQHQAAHLALCKQNVPDDFLAMRIVKLANQRDEARTEADIQSAGYTQCRCDLTRMIEQRDEALAEVEPLKRELAQAISERTPHDYGILRDQRDEARTGVKLLKQDVEKLLQENWQLGTDRDETRAEVERLKRDLEIERAEVARLLDERDRARAEVTRLNGELKRTMEALAKAKIYTERSRSESVRKEPSRLEIAAMFLANVSESCVMTIEGALNAADNLIAAAKEGQ
jgi:chromosome segregation ATPase